MPPTKRSADFVALEQIHTALAPLDPETRARVLSSVSQLLDVGSFSPAATSSVPAATAPVSSRVAGVQQPLAQTRPLSLIELVQDKQPTTIPEKIAVFAYFREKYENKPQFSREDLRTYFARARTAPPGNYDRDFVRAVQKGWIHEEDSESYLTSRGVEAVESGFAAAKPARTRKSAKNGRRQRRTRSVRGGKKR